MSSVTRAEPSIVRRLHGSILPRATPVPYQPADGRPTVILSARERRKRVRGKRQERREEKRNSRAARFSWTGQGCPGTRLIASAWSHWSSLRMLLLCRGRPTNRFRNVSANCQLVCPTGCACHRFGKQQCRRISPAANAARCESAIARHHDGWLLLHSGRNWLSEVCG